MVVDYFFFLGIVGGDRALRGEGGGMLEVCEVIY